MVTCYGITPNTRKGDGIIKEVVRLLLGGIEGGGADYETGRTETTDPYWLLVGQTD